MPPQLWKLDSLILFTKNVCVRYDSPCIRSKSSLLAVQKLEGMQYSKHLRNFPKFSLSSLSFMHSRTGWWPEKNFGMKLFKTILVTSLQNSQLHQTRDNFS